MRLCVCYECHWLSDSCIFPTESVLDSEIGLLTPIYEIRALFFFRFSHIVKSHDLQDSTRRLDNLQNLGSVATQQFQEFENWQRLRSSLPRAIVRRVKVLSSPGSFFGIFCYLNTHVHWQYSTQSEEYEEMIRLILTGYCVVALFVNSSLGFYLPGLAPVNYCIKNQNVNKECKVNKLIRCKCHVFCYSNVLFS